MKVLLIIVGVIIALAGLGTICGGGMYALMLTGMTEAMREFEAAVQSGEIEMDENAAELNSEFLKKLAPVIPLVSVAFMIASLMMAAAQIWLGVGTILCRRWSWKLLYSLGWLYTGWIVISGIAMLGFIPGYLKMMEIMMELPSTMASSTGSGSGGSGAPAAPPTPPPMPTGMMGGLSVVWMLFSLAINAVPGVILIIVFGLRNVRLTCEMYDPEPRWTDKVPVPVLVMWLTAIGAVGYLITFAIPSLPLAGIFLPTSTVTLIFAGLLVSIGLMAAVAYLTPKLNPLAWWILMISSVVSTALYLMFMTRLDIETVWNWLAKLGVPESARTEFEKEMPPELVEVIFDMSTNWLPTVLTSIAVIGYLAWIKRFFDAANQPKALGEG